MRLLKPRKVSWMTGLFQKSVDVPRALDAVPRNDIAGYGTRIPDGNHLYATGPRLKEARDATAALLPTSYQQTFTLPDSGGRSLTVQRKMIKLKDVTRDGETDIELLTNVPVERGDALAIAELSGLGSRSQRPFSIWLIR